MLSGHGKRFKSIQICMGLGIALMFFASVCLADPIVEPIVNKSDYVSFDFNNVDINVLIKFISKLTHKNFVVDNKVKGSVTIISPTKISIPDAYKVFLSVLDIHGYTTVESGSVIKVVPVADARSDNVDTRLSAGMENLADQIVTRIIPLQYANSDELKTLLMPLVSKGNIIQSYGDTNMLIVTATLSSIERLVKIIDTIDIESIGQKITVLPIKYADAVKLVQSLSTIYSARVKNSKTKKDLELTIKLVADERTNSMILLASDLESQRISHLVDILDKQAPKGEEKIRVYYLEHAKAEDMAKVLQDIPAKDSTKTQGEKKAPLLSEEIKITADRETNSLLIIANKEDYPILEEVIHQLDIPRAMVYIECLIMEVNADKGLNIGTEWRLSEGFGNDSGVVFGGFGATGDSGFANSSSAASSGSLSKGFSLGVLGKQISIGGVTFPSLQAVIQAYQSDKDVQILSTPQILTTENKEATITIGKNVPYQTRSAADSGTETYSSYEYKDVGITLKITPSISKDRLVRLDVYQEVTRLDLASTTNSDRPTTLKRQIQTSIIVEDNNTVVIGGLIDESLSKTVGQVPCLGGIPFLGYLFKNESSGSERTNLYVFLTPRVVKSSMEAKTLYQEKTMEIQELKKEEIKLYGDHDFQKGLLLD
ncbi:MAG: type II secretion system secretin GspD [Pseudomonadota bacterium]